MEEFVAYIVKNLVSDTEGVQVKTVEDAEKLKIEIYVSPDDVGKVIGRKGNTINALRTIVRTVATRLGRRVQVDLIQPEKDEEKTEELISEAPEVVETAAEELVQEEVVSEELVQEEAVSEESAEEEAVSEESVIKETVEA